MLCKCPLIKQLKNLNILRFSEDPTHPWIDVSERTKSPILINNGNLLLNMKVENNNCRRNYFHVSTCFRMGTPDYLRKLLKESFFVHPFVRNKMAQFVCAFKIGFILTNWDSIELQTSNKFYLFHDFHKIRSDSFFKWNQVVF